MSSIAVLRPCTPEVLPDEALCVREHDAVFEVCESLCRLRGALDEAIAWCVAVAGEMDDEHKAVVLAACLRNVRPAVDRGWKGVNL